MKESTSATIAHVGPNTWTRWPTIRAYENTLQFGANRKQDGKIKTILDGSGKTVTINCDLILHTHGANIAADDLIAIEVKKHDTPDKAKQQDRERLRALTKASYDGVWMNDGSAPPEHVYGYRLGAFVELDRKRRICRVEYYKNGEYESESEHPF